MQADLALHSPKNKSLVAIRIRVIVPYDAEVSPYDIEVGCRKAVLVMTLHENIDIRNNFTATGQICRKKYFRFYNFFSTHSMIHASSIYITFNENDDKNLILGLLIYYHNYYCYYIFVYFYQSFTLRQPSGKNNSFVLYLTLLFKVISVISRRPVYLPMVSWNSFYQYSAKDAFQATGYFPHINIAETMESNAFANRAPVYY